MTYLLSFDQIKYFLTNFQASLTSGALDALRENIVWLDSLKNKKLEIFKTIGTIKLHLNSKFQILLDTLCRQWIGNSLVWTSRESRLGTSQDQSGLQSKIVQKAQVNSSFLLKEQNFIYCTHTLIADWFSIKSQRGLSARISLFAKKKIPSSGMIHFFNFFYILVKN